MQKLQSTRIRDATAERARPQSGAGYYGLRPRRTFVDSIEWAFYSSRPFVGP